jgi:hypothetical protein
MALGFLLQTGKDFQYSHPCYQRYTPEEEEEEEEECWYLRGSFLPARVVGWLLGA